MSAKESPHGVPLFITTCTARLPTSSRSPPKPMSQGTTYVYRLHLPPMVAEAAKPKQPRPSPSSLDPEVGPQAKRSKNQQENPFDMLHLECFTYVMSFLGGRGLTMYAHFSPRPHGHVPVFRPNSLSYTLLVPPCDLLCLYPSEQLRLNYA